MAAKTTSSSTIQAQAPTELGDNSTVPISWLVWIVVGCFSVMTCGVTVTYYVSTVEKKAELADQHASQVEKMTTSSSDDLNKKMDTMIGYLQSIDQRVARMEGARRYRASRDE